MDLNPIDVQNSDAILQVSTAAIQRLLHEALERRGAQVEQAVRGEEWELVVQIRREVAQALAITERHRIPKDELFIKLGNPDDQLLASYLMSHDPIFRVSVERLSRLLLEYIETARRLKPVSDTPAPESQS